MRGYSQFSCWISIALVKMYISCIIINRGKNTIELVGSVLKIDDCRNCLLSLNLVNSRCFLNKNEFYFRYLWPKLKVVFVKVTKGKEKKYAAKKGENVNTIPFADSEESDVICIT